jgi:serine/threonine protein kinase/outer membrane protein assembly factor BamB
MVLPAVDKFRRRAIMSNRVGQQIDDYRLISLLGTGTFGEVYLGEHIYHRSQVAIKVLKIHLTADRLKEFLNEARTIRLKHPHIVQLLDFGINEDTPFLVMDYAPKGTLHQRYPQGSRLPIRDILPYVNQIASALQYAHNMRLIHRDVKPQNMLLGSDGRVLLSDFGIAVVAHSEHSLTTQEMAGTVPYMAPEQIQGKPRPASDQYALGIVIYEWLCGTRPFHGTQWEIINQQLYTPPPSLKEKAPATPLAVEEVILKALAKEPSERFTSVQEFATALEKAYQLTETFQATSSSGHQSSTSTHISKEPTVLLSNADTPSNSSSISESISSLPQQALTQFTPLSAPNQLSEPILPTTSPGPDSLPPIITPNQTLPLSTFTNSTNLNQPPIQFIQTSNPQPTRISHYKGISKSKIGLCVGLILLVIAGSIGLPYMTRHNYTPVSTNRSNARTNTNTSAEAHNTATARTNALAQASYVHAYNTATAAGVMFGFDAEHTHVNPYEHILNPTNVSKLVNIWTFYTKNEPGTSSFPIISNGIVYFGAGATPDNNGTLYALNASSGKQLWTYKTTGSINSSPAVANGIVYFGANEFYALDATSGSKLWSFQTTGTVDSSPTIANGIIYFGSSDGTLYALNAKTGTKIWSYYTGYNYDIASSPAIANGIIYFGTYGAILYALNAQTGSELWNYATGANGIAGDYIDSSPAIANGIVYTAWHDGGLYAFNARSGSELWNYGGLFDSSPTIANGIVYITEQGGYLQALDAKSGTELWSQNPLTGSSEDYDCSPTIANGIVYFDGGTLYALNAQSGVKLWTRSFGNGSPAFTAVANGVLYAYTGFYGVLYAFHLPNTSIT